MLRVAGSLASSARMDAACARSWRINRALWEGGRAWAGRTQSEALNAEIAARRLPRTPRANHPKQATRAPLSHHRQQALLQEAQALDAHVSTLPERRIRGPDVARNVAERAHQRVTAGEREACGRARTVRRRDERPRQVDRTEHQLHLQHDRRSVSAAAPRDGRLALREQVPACAVCLQPLLCVLPASSGGPPGSSKSRTLAPHGMARPNARPHARAHRMSA